VDRDRSGVGPTKVVVGDSHELLDDVVGRRGAVDEEEIVVVDIGVQESLFIVLFLVEADDPFDVELLEDVHVLSWVMAVALVCISLLDRAHKSHELAGNDPIEVAVLDPLVELVLLDVEGLEIVPLKFDGVLEPLQALQKCTLVKAVALACISIVLE